MLYSLFFSLFKISGPSNPKALPGQDLTSGHPEQVAVSPEVHLHGIRTRDQTGFHRSRSVWTTKAQRKRPGQIEEHSNNNLIKKVHKFQFFHFSKQKFKRNLFQIFLYLNTKASLYDTTSSAKGYHQVEEKEYTKRSFTFDRLQDIVKYWLAQNHFIYVGLF